MHSDFDINGNDRELHEDRGRHLVVRGTVQRGGPDDGTVSPDYQAVGVYLSQQVAPGSVPTIAMSCRDDAGAAHTFIEFNPVQAMEVARLLGTAAAAAVTGKEDHRENAA